MWQKTSNGLVIQTVVLQTVVLHSFKGMHMTKPTLCERRSIHHPFYLTICPVTQSLTSTDNIVLPNYEKHAADRLIVVDGHTEWSHCVTALSCGE